MDTTSGGGDNIPKDTKRDKTVLIPGGKPTGVAKPGVTCIGEICFTDEGFVVKIPDDADPECAKRVAEDILKGDAKIVYEVSPKAIAKSKDEYVEHMTAKDEIKALEKRLKELKA